MARSIRCKGNSSEDNESIELILPEFVLCLRDFSLKLIKDGKKITENEYLEQSLAENNSKADQFNKPRACIKKYFKKRECFAFPVPGDGDVLENLETLSFSQLSKRFKEVTGRFTSYIYKIPPKNLLASKPINGQMFVTLANHYVTTIKNGAVPDVDDAFTAVAKMENAKIEKEALEIFENEMEKVTLPVPKSNLRNCYTNAQQIMLHYLRKNVVHDFQAKCELQAQILSTWYGFEERMRTTEAKIVEADESVSQKEKEAEQRKTKENLEALLNQQQKAQEDALEKQKKIFEDHYDKLDKERREQQKIINERYLELINERMGKAAEQREVERLKSLQEATEKEMARYRREKEAVEELAKRSIFAQKVAERTAECFKMEKEEARKARKEAPEKKERVREETMMHKLENEPCHRKNEASRKKTLFLRIAEAITNNK